MTLHVFVGFFTTFTCFDLWAPARLSQVTDERTEERRGKGMGERRVNWSGSCLANSNVANT